MVPVVGLFVFKNKTVHWRRPGRREGWIDCVCAGTRKRCHLCASGSPFRRFCLCFRINGIDCI